MKKRAAGLIAASLALALCAPFCPLASAAGHNPYADVPKDDWSYSAVESLIDQGLVTGMTVDDYHNLKRLTRNDLAVYIAQAVSQRENANMKSRDLIYRLVKAYSYELHAIGVDDEFVPEVPKEKEEDTRPEIYKKLDRLTLQGWAYIRQDHYESSGASMGRQRTLTHLTENGIDVSLGYTYKFNDNWSFIGSADFYRNLNHEDTTANMNMKSMYLLGHMHGYDIRAGHYDPSNGLGMVFGDSIDKSVLTKVYNGEQVVVKDKDGAIKVKDKAESGDAELPIQAILKQSDEYVGQDVNGRWGDDKLYEKRSRPDVFSYRVHGMMGHGTWGGLGVYYFTRGNVELYQDP